MLTIVLQAVSCTFPTRNSFYHFGYIIDLSTCTFPTKTTVLRMDQHSDKDHIIYKTGWKTQLITLLTLRWAIT